jgi:hypothetical protein
VLVVAIIVIATQIPRRDRHDRHDMAPPGAQTATYPTTETYPAGGLPPASYAVPEQPRPVNPRKKGPILLWFALAVMVVAIGALGIADLAGADVAPSAYPATVLGLSAAFLLLGSFWGRAGGIILVGLTAAFATAGTTVADHWDPHSATYVPAQASQVQSTYTMDVGEIVLDLTDVKDPQELDGREISLDGDVGHLDIRVPSDMTVVADTHVTGIGGINAFGRDGGGIDTQLTAVHSGGADAPRLTINADLHVGGIDVHTEQGD